MITLQTKQRVVNGVVLSCAADLGARIIRRVSGNDISSSINGAPATSDVIQLLLMQRITSRLMDRCKTSKQ